MPGQALVTIKDKQWDCSVANTLTELTTGLSGVESLAPSTGMLFDLGGERGYIEIDMSQMLFPLDIIFINSCQGVVGVLKDVQSGHNVFFDAGTMPGARLFLEVNAGEAEGIESGDEVMIQGDIPAAGLDAVGWIQLILVVGVISIPIGIVGGELDNKLISR